ncbi:MAG: MFS transporter [Alphaproteobacteria bacterium]
MINLGGIGQAFSNPNFRLYTYGSSISLIGTWLQKAAVAWLAWELTKDPKWLGIVVLADLLPAVLSSPFAGVLADRLNRRRMLILLQSLMLVQALVLALLTYTGLINIGLLIGFTVVLGVIMGFNHPTRQSLINSLVRREHLSSAVALTSVIFNTGRVIGPAIAGFVIAAFGSDGAFALNALSFLPMLVALFYMQLPAQEVPVRSAAGFFGDMAAGYRYAARHAGIGPMLLIGLSLALLFRPLTEMIAAYVGQVFMGGPEQLGQLMAAGGLGAVVSGIWLAWRGGGGRGLVNIAVGSILASAAILLAFGFTTNVWVATGLMFLMGVVMTMRGTSTQTLVQMAVDPVMRGRVLSLHTMIFNAGPAIGSFALGLVATWAGLHVPLQVAAAINVVVWGWALSRRRRLIAALEPEGATPGGMPDSGPAAAPTAQTPVVGPARRLPGE